MAKDYTFLWFIIGGCGLYLAMVSGVLFEDE